MSTVSVNFDLHKSLRLLPGYDPFATAGNCVFDDEAAINAIGFIEECCTHTKGVLAGKPLLLQPWQKGLVGNLFGWKRPDGTRRYRECLVFIPRKNGKTLIAAALTLLVMYTDGEPGAELYSSAAERDQARLCFDVVARQIHNSRELSALAEVYKYSIVVGSNSYKAISAEASSKHGYNAHLIVNDELHAHKTPELTEVLMTSTGARRQPLVVHLTTSDFEREGSVCNQKHDYACKVRDGVISDPAFLPVIYEASREDDWTDPATWHKANPNLGVSFPLDYLERESQRAKDDPAYENTFKRLHLNIRTEQAFRLIQMHHWDACDGPVEIPDGAAVWVGLDVAATQDMAAACACYRDEEDRYHLSLTYWCPQDKARELEAKGDPTYLAWERAGYLRLTPGASIDQRTIRADLIALGERYSIQEIAFDPWNTTALAQQLGEEDGFEMVEHRQGTVSMNEPTKLLITAMLDGRLRHGGHPVLRWNAANLAARSDPSDNIRPDKANSAGKIDGIVAAIMAIGRASVSPGEEVSFYETHGLEAV